MGAPLAKQPKQPINQAVLAAIYQLLAGWFSCELRENTRHKHKQKQKNLNLNRKSAKYTQYKALQEQGGWWQSKGRQEKAVCISELLLAACGAAAFCSQKKI